jgi:hypothetical protein
VSTVLGKPRPLPSRLVPTIAGTILVLLALPVFLVAGWPLTGWLLAAVLWAAGQALEFLFARLPLGADNLASSGVVGLGMAFRGIGVMIVLLAVTVANQPVGVAAVIVYALTYTLSLGISIVEYFGGSR